MGTFSLEIRTNNDAFAGDEGPTEVRRILTEIGCKIDLGATSGSVMDINGKTVVSWRWSR